jgi:hypothetical protein
LILRPGLTFPAPMTAGGLSLLCALRARPEEGASVTLGGGAMKTAAGVTTVGGRSAQRDRLRLY